MKGLTDSAQHAVNRALADWAMGLTTEQIVRKIHQLLSDHCGELNGEERAVLQRAVVQLTPKEGQ